MNIKLNLKLYKPIVEAVKYMNNERICSECNLAFIPAHGNQKYCGDECSRNAKKDQDRQARLKYKVQWGRRFFGVGTGCLGKHRETDFIKEEIMVRKEMERCGLV